MSELKLKRIEKGLSQEKLSEISSVPRITIVRYEAGAGMSVENLLKLSKALDCKVDDLIAKEA